MLEWAIGLLILALILYAVELFVPSGGLIGFLATLSLLGGIVCVFLVNTTAGIVVTVLTVIATPFVIALFLKVFPNTPIGRLLTLSDDQKAGAVHYDKAFEDEGRDLLGKQGVAVHDLRPIGTCDVNGHHIDCFAESGVIEAGTRVEVTSVAGMHVTVKAV